MFKWACLSVAVLAVVVLGWMINDLRLEIRRAALTTNEHLPAILAKAQSSTEKLDAHLPQIVEKTQKTTDTLAELAEDVRQLKELAGVSVTARDTTLVAYANDVLKFIEASGGSIGEKKLLSKGLKDAVPAKEWVVGGRKKALYLTAVSRSKREFLEGLCDRFLATKWSIQLGDQPPMLLLDWLLANHPDSKDVKKS